jgi:alkylation response protein AidB-like acyl-CoA dehydrogenase
MSDTETVIAIGEDYPELQDAVKKLCADFPGEYWRTLEDQNVDGSYPTEFVKTLTESGFLGALIPEEYGGAGLPIRAGAVILETIHESGCSAGACHAQMYTMGTPGSCAYKPSASPSRPPAPTPPSLRPVRRKTVTGIASMARKSGRAGRCTPT